ncbi:MAG: adenylosuccinate synthase [Flavobacteriales bacterium]|nr:adenylosuccinate synthase [Flavobacteriales bacterium]MCX7768232.1 adenylosuccinate synthase [Flavobacteriales bacterium]MDW8410131.1 adenylosuccinate synthase [Flavobacteriales bacterium]
MKGSLDILLGLQWGDEGKGKVVDYLAPNYQMVARFQGGPNAGHSLVFNGSKFVLHTIPSGIFRESCINFIGHGVVIDPITLRQEVEAVQKAGVSTQGRLFIARKAHLIIPTHKVLDAASEQAKGRQRVGSTLRGIGPAYMDKTGRNGLRVGDIYSAGFEKKLRALMDKHRLLILSMKYDPPEWPSLDPWLEAVDQLRRMDVVDGEYFIYEKIQEGARILAEGAQGTLLDIDHGTYPYVTSSSTVAAGACLGLGLPPSAVRNVFGVFKAYCTRVGSGPFPTEQTDETGHLLRTKGHEFGATTGRPRRCGWLDLVALRYAIMVNGVNHLMMMKADVLSGLPQVKAAVAYDLEGTRRNDFPFDLTELDVRPIYKEFPGWETICTEGCTFSKEFMDFLAYIERVTRLPVNLVSYGPDRQHTCIRKDVSLVEGSV